MTEYFLQKKCPNCSRKPGLGMGKNPCKDCGGTPPTFRLTDDKTWEEFLMKPKRRIGIIISTLLLGALSVNSLLAAFFLYSSAALPTLVGHSL